MKRNDAISEKIQPQAGNFSLSPKGTVYISAKDSAGFPFETGENPLAIIDGMKFYFIQDRFFLYGISSKTKGNFYSTSYQKASDEITLWERSGEQAKQIAKDTPTNLKRDFKLSTGVILTTAIQVDDVCYCVDLKLQASSRSEWIDFLNQCRRDRNFADFTIEPGSDKDFGTVYRFKRHGIDPDSELQAFIDKIESEI